MSKNILKINKRMEITFNYNGIDILYQCNDTRESLNDIFHKLRNDVDINKIIFLYSGYQIDGNISINEYINKEDLKRNKMSIIVMDKEKNLESVYKIPKNIICPKCGESYKLDILLDEYEYKQRIDILKIICDECKINNKVKSYKNILFKCNECKKDLYFSCKDNEEKPYLEHNIINYNDKNYICNKHNEKYSSYCKKCNKNICMYCEHKGHEIINFIDNLPNININKLRNDINIFKEIINDAIKKLNKIKDNIEYYYNANNEIYNSIKNKHINYELLYNYNKINKSNIMNDINDIINNKNNRYQKLNEIN